MKTLFVIFSFAFLGCFNAQIYLDVDFQAPSTTLTSDGVLSAQVINYPGSANYSIEVFDLLTSTISVVSGNFIDTLKFNSIVTVYAYEGLDTFAIHLQTIALGAPFDTAKIDFTGIIDPITTISCDGAFSYQCNLSDTQLASEDFLIILESLDNFTGNSTVFNSSTQSSGLFQNICSGLYMVTLGDNSQGFFATKTSILFQSQLVSVNNPTFYVEVQHSVNTLDSACDATAEANVVGTTGPYQFSYDGSNYSYDSTASNLCGGLHLLRVIDNGNDTLVHYFSVADSSQFLSQNNGVSGFVDSMSIDFQNCNFDYSIAVDSANILMIDSVSIDTYSWTIEIWQNGVYNVYTDTITMSVIMNGLNHCYIAVFCPVKSSGSKTFKFADSYFYGANPSGIGEKTSDFSVFPNPVSNTLHFLQNNASRFIVTDITGKTVMEGNISINQIDVTELNHGTYLFTLMDDSGTLIGVSKFIRN